MFRLLATHVKPSLFSRHYSPVAFSGLPHYGTVRQQLIVAATSNNFTDERWVTAAFAQQYLSVNAKAITTRVKLPQGEYVDTFNMSMVTVPHNCEHFAKGKRNSNNNVHRAVLGFAFAGTGQDFFSAHAKAHGLKSNCWVTKQEMAVLQWKSIDGATPLELEHTVAYGFGSSAVVLQLFNAQQIADIIDFTKYFTYRRMFRLAKGVPIAPATTLEIQQHLAKIGIACNVPNVYHTPNRFVGTRADIQHLTSRRCDVLPGAIPFRHVTKDGDVIELYVPDQTDDPAAVVIAAVGARKAKLSKRLNDSNAESNPHHTPMELSI